MTSPISSQQNSVAAPAAGTGPNARGSVNFVNHFAVSRPLICSFLVGLAGACGFEPLGLWPLTIIAFAVLLWLIEGAPTLRSALARGYWFGAGHFMLGLNWIATAFTFQAAMPAWLGWVAVVLLSLYLAVYPAIAAGLAWRWGHGRMHFTLIFAAAWIVAEWLRATMFTGFAWNPEAVALLPTPVSRAAALIGTYGLSGLLMLLAGALLLLARRQFRPAAALLAPVVGLPLLALVCQGVPLATKPLPIRIVQPNIGQDQKWQAEFAEANMARLARLSLPKPESPRLLLWPEAAVTDPLEDPRQRRLPQLKLRETRAAVARLIGPDELLLTGGVTFRSADGLFLTSATNSIFAIAPGGRILGRYDKAHLVPYGEYLPMRPLLSAIGLSRLAPGDVDFDSGPGPRTLTLPLVGKVGFQLCYEIIFSGQVVDRGDRPRVIFNPSNDAWFGAWGPPQHLAQARLRALEEGLPVLRSTPTGISAVVDAHGRLVASIPPHRFGAIDAMLPPPLPPTWFARLGNLAPFLFALLIIAVAVATRRRYGRT